MRPYDFTHLELAHSFNKEPHSHHWFPSPATVSQTRTILNMLWGRGNVYVDAPPEVRVVATSEVNGRNFTIVGMPAPKEPGESYFAAFVSVGEDGSPGGYFVWDRSGSRGKATMAEYRGPTMRINMGTYDDPSLDGFAAQLADTFKLDDLPLTMAPAPAGVSPSASVGARPKKKRSGCVTAILVLFALQLIAAVVAIAVLETQTDLKKPGSWLGSKKVKEGDAFSITLEPPAYGVGHDTVWYEVFGGKFEDAKFKLKGSIQCKRGKKTFKKKSIAISHDSSKKIKTLHETDVRGKYRLATYTSKAGGRPLVCKGRIEADPGTISHALVEGTRQQRPSDFVADLLKR